MRTIKGSILQQAEEIAQNRLIFSATACVKGFEISEQATRSFHSKIAINKLFSKSFHLPPVDTFG